MVCTRRYLFRSTEQSTLYYHQLLNYIDDESFSENKGNCNC